MIEQVLHPYNVQCALKQVIANKGSAGVDGIKVRNLTDCFRKAQAQLYSSIREMMVSIRSATYCKSKKNPQAGIARLGSWSFLSCSGISWN